MIKITLVVPLMLHPEQFASFTVLNDLEFPNVPSKGDTINIENFVVTVETVHYTPKRDNKNQFEIRVTCSYR